MHQIRRRSKHLVSQSPAPPLTTNPFTRLLDAIVPDPRAHWFVQDYNGSRDSLSTDCHPGRWTHKHRGRRKVACTIQQRYWSDAQHRLDCHVWELQRWGWPTPQTNGTPNGIMAANIWRLADRYLVTRPPSQLTQPFLDLATALMTSVDENLQIISAYDTLCKNLDRLAALGDQVAVDKDTYLARLEYIEHSQAAGLAQLTAIVTAAERAQASELRAELYGTLSTQAALPTVPDAPATVLLDAITSTAHRLDG
jgi:hypothetical protein